MVTKIKLLALLVAAVILLLQGCPAPSVTKVYNNSTMDVIVMLKHGSWIWHRGEVISIDRDYLEQLEWIRQDGYLHPVLKVGVSGKINVYDLSLPNRAITGDYVRMSSGVRAIHYRLDEDERLYILNPNSEWTVDITMQPDGFPIEPRQTVIPQKIN